MGNEVKLKNRRAQAEPAIETAAADHAQAFAARKAIADRKSPAFAEADRAWLGALKLQNEASAKLLEPLAARERYEAERKKLEDRQAQAEAAFERATAECDSAFAARQDIADQESPAFAEADRAWLGALKRQHKHAADILAARKRLGAVEGEIAKLDGGAE